MNTTTVMDTLNKFDNELESFSQSAATYNCKFFFSFEGCLIRNLR